MSEYVPQPLDTSGVQLEPLLMDLQEQLAQNAHEVWAQQRIADGWTPGPRRDDARKEHPCLVPYAQLPESEKAYDRAVVRSVLTGILALGYTLQPPSPPTPPTPTREVDSAPFPDL